MDGKAAAATTVARKRAVFSGALKYAVELRLIESHPMTHVSWTAPKSTEEIDRRVVVNPVQARALLRAVRDIAPDFEAFFGCMYYSALRPEECLHLREHDFERPAKPGEWGCLNLTGVMVGEEWSDDGAATEDRALKHRARIATWRVPVPPPTVELLTTHLDKYGADREGRLFVTRRGAGGRYLPTTGRSFSSNAYGRVWRKAREKGTDRGRASLSPGEGALPPTPRSRVPLAQGRRTRTAGRRVGRAQRARPDEGLRQVP
jgi:integrase